MRWRGYKCKDESKTLDSCFRRNDGFGVSLAIFIYWRPDCALVRSRLHELEIEYKRVIVPGQIAPARSPLVTRHADG